MRLLLNGVDIELMNDLPKVNPVEYENMNIWANDHQFRMLVPDVAEFYAENGDRVLIKELGGSQKSISLYLNGSVLGALLDQRKILTIHGSSFKLNDKTIVLCGESGFGKSSITYYLVKQFKAHFITDDITPILKGDILPISNSLKLWQDSIDQLGVSVSEDNALEYRSDKFLIEMNSIHERLKPDIILFGSLSDSNEFSLNEIQGGEKFSASLANQYWKNLTSAVRESRIETFSEITELCNSVAMFDFRRPMDASIKDSGEFLIDFLNKKTS